MLSTSHNRAYQHFLTLLTEFKKFVLNLDVDTSLAAVNQEFQSLQQWFSGNIVNLDSQDIDPSIAPRWESIQREIEREFKLLGTDILFLASARQIATKNKRLESIINRTSKLIGYCQGLLETKSKD